MRPTRLFAAALVSAAATGLAAGAEAAGCSDLPRFALPKGVITSARSIPAGAFRPGGLVAAASTGPPRCPYGQVAQWNGTGSTDDTASFACVAARVDPDGWRPR